MRTIYRPSCYPQTTDAPHRRCQLPAQTLRLRNHKRSLKIKNLSAGWYQDQVVEKCGFISVVVRLFDILNKIVEMQSHNKIKSAFLINYFLGCVEIALFNFFHHHFYT